MKNLMISFIVFFLISLDPIKIYSQEIEIDSTFKSSFEIFPFDQIQNLSGITMEGDVHLNRDTSLVRVILKDNNGFQYMIFETYSLICPNLDTNFSNHCDETCFLEQVSPYSIIIQVIDATLNLKSFFYSTEPKENALEERYKAKRSFDATKIETMNQLIPIYNLNWVAGDNSLVALYYDQKRTLFGVGYNLRGFDYYTGGVFEALGHRPYPKANPDLVRNFDWRNRHGANDSLSLYWDGDTEGTGWLTSVKNQGDEGTCYAFGPVGASEALTNVFTNSHVDFDLSERYLVVCNSHCRTIVCVIDSLIGTGVITENCLPYSKYRCDEICDPIDTFFKITEKEEININNPDSIRLALIKNGPLVFNYIPTGGHEGHSVTLSGYIFNFIDSTITWIIKNSWGDSVGVKGFYTMPIDNISSVYAPIGPVKVNDTILPVHCHDYDDDGYCFWGIGPKPASCDTCDCFEEEDCDDNDSLVGGYDENFNCKCNLEEDPIAHHVSADTNWSDTTYVNYQVIVDSGSCLTISSFTTFAPQAYIVVLPGAELIIDGGYLTKACPNDLWRGIEVWGSDTLQAFDQYFGKVVMTNNSVIEFAKTGIANHCTRCAYNQMQSGGIILADNSTFRNNETDILLAPFKNLWFGREYPYTGSYIKCQFITTDNFYPAHLPKAHIEMKNVYGVQFYGCVFKNESDLAVYPYSVRGKGISSIDANYMLLVYCNNPNINPCDDLDSCKFIGLEYGIKSLNAISVRTLNIQDVIFESNLLGISLSGIDNASLLSNQINCSEIIQGISPDRFIGGIFLEGCSGYHIENNYIHDVISDTGNMGISKKNYGMGIKNSGPDFNEVYNNRLESLKAGIYSIGENRSSKSGLCLKCNDMDDNANDFVVDSIPNHPTGNHQGIYNYQGDPKDSVSVSAPAGNVFSFFDSPANYNTLSRFNYFNNAEDIRYTHHHSQYFRVAPLDSNYTRATIELKGWQNLFYDKETACPSALGGGGSLKTYSDPWSAIFEANNHISLLTSQLNSLIDGGNTEELNFEVMTSFPDEGLEIRQELLNESPYLSDTVLKQAINKEDVLPNAMIRDILEANPQSAKSDEVLNNLDGRLEPMPDYMMAQIMQGKKYLGAKELLEAEIQSWSQIKAQAKADLFRHFLLDTNTVNPVDSVIDFLENENDLKSMYDLAIAYWNIKDSSNALLTINNIPSQFILDDSQYIVHLQYGTYFGTLKMIEDSNWFASDLNQSSVQTLFNLMEDGNTDIAACARGLLVKGGFFEYIETVNLPDNVKSSEPKFNSNNIIIKPPNQDYLRLFPNPAGDYVIAYYDIDLKYNTGEITIKDLKGNVLRSQIVSSGKNQVVFNLKNLPNGLYIFTLNANNQRLQSKKISKGGY
jgi:hypothetical protein